MLVFAFSILERNKFKLLIIRIFSVIFVPRFFLLLFSARYMGAKVIKNLGNEQISDEKILFFENFSSKVKKSTRKVCGFGILQYICTQILNLKIMDLTHNIIKYVNSSIGAFASRFKPLLVGYEDGS